MWDESREADRKAAGSDDEDEDNERGRSPGSAALATAVAYVPHPFAFVSDDRAWNSSPRLGRAGLGLASSLCLSLSQTMRTGSTGKCYLDLPGQNAGDFHLKERDAVLRRYRMEAIGTTFSWLL